MRNSIGIVPQDAFLFSDTIKNNIKFGKENATDEEVNLLQKMLWFMTTSWVSTNNMKLFLAKEELHFLADKNNGFYCQSDYQKS